jgi:hypothetical protein
MNGQGVITVHESLVAAFTHALPPEHRILAERPGEETIEFIIEGPGLPAPADPPVPISMLCTVRNGAEPQRIFCVWIDQRTGERIGVPEWEAESRYP